MIPAMLISISSPEDYCNLPNGGENWIRGKAYTITWNYTGNPGTYVKIELLKNGWLIEPSSQAL